MTGRRIIRALLWTGVAAGLAGCGASTSSTSRATEPVATSLDAPEQITLSIIGLNDVHGRVGRVAVIGGYVDNLRRAREATGGAVLVVDAGDMFQGTLESNIAEGAPMVDAYNALGVVAAAVGNHEFDYGPVGPDTTPSPERDDQDPRGALLARAAQARFPLLVANLSQRDGTPVRWPGVQASTMVRAAGVQVGIIGATTEEALLSTIAGNVRDLRVDPIVPAVRREAAALRAAGATVVLLTVHAGGRCDALNESDGRDGEDGGAGDTTEPAHDPDDVSSCHPEEEIMSVASELGPGVVDLVVAGHTHWAMAHRVAGVPIIESYSNGYAFGRADITVSLGANGAGPTETQSPARVHVELFEPQPTCTNPHGVLGDCATEPYEGRPVVPHVGVVAAISPALQYAEALRARELGVTVVGGLRRLHRDESPLGNLFADMMMELFPESDLALMNAGGVRHSIGAGALTYGALYEAMPFDNRFATVRLRGADVRRMLETNVASDNGMLLVSGITAVARCEGDAVRVSLADANGNAIDDAQALTMITNDFMATSDRHDFARIRAAGGVTLDPGPPMRDRFAERLAARGGELNGADPALFDAQNLRVRFPGRRPMTCGTSAD